jgi:RNA polymerase sigma-70 factor, ECF subfamily
VPQERSFDEIYRRTGPRLWRAILAYTGGRRDLTDDVVAEAFARTLAHQRAIRDPDAYLFRIAFRLAAQELRRPAARDDVPDAAAPDDPGLVEVFSLLRHLSPGERAAIFLHAQADLPAAEVARLTGTSAAVVRVQLMRGRRKLRRLLEEDDRD